MASQSGYVREFLDWRTAEALNHGCVDQRLKAALQLMLDLVDHQRMPSNLYSLDTGVRNTGRCNAKPTMRKTIPTPAAKAATP